MDENQSSKYSSFHKSLKYPLKRYNTLKFYNKIFNLLVRLNNSDNSIFIHY